MEGGEKRRYGGNEVRTDRGPVKWWENEWLNLILKVHGIDVFYI